MGLRSTAFHRHATQELTSLYAIQDYQNEFRFHLPHEHRPAGRPAKTTPLTPILEQAGAHFTVVNGWERSDYFKPTPDFVEDYGYRYTKVHELVAAEVARVQNHVALAEVNGFNRIEITGPGARRLAGLYDLLSRAAQNWKTGAWVSSQ